MLLDPLRAAWDSDKMGIGRAQDESGEWNPEAVHGALHCSWFRAFLDLVVRVGRIFQELAAWSEECPCHRHLQATYRGHVPAAVTRAEFGSESSTSRLSCPLRGCNAPEMAAGAVRDLLDGACEGVASSLAAAWRSQLSREEWRQLLAELDKAKGHIAQLVIMKTQHWQELPWLLCGLAHADESAARRVTAAALDKFDSSDESKHHRVSLRFLSKSGSKSLRSQVELFGEGQPLHTLPQLSAEIAKFRCIPLTERSIEAPHGDIFKALTHKHHGPVSVSMAVRLQQIEALACGDTFDCLCDVLANLKKVRKIPAALGLQHHPWVQSMPKHSTTSSWTSPLTQVIYRCDGTSQYASFASARDAWLRGRRARLKAAGGKAPLPDLTETLSCCGWRRSTSGSECQLARSRPCRATCPSPSSSRSGSCVGSAKTLCWSQALQPQ